MKGKYVKIYSLKEEGVYFNGKNIYEDSVYIYEDKKSLSMDRLDKEGATINDAYSYQELPIHTVRKMGRYGADFSHIFVIDPDLREVLENPIRRDYRERLNNIQDQHKQSLNYERDIVKELVQDINNYNSLPWYKRIFKRIGEE